MTVMYRLILLFLPVFMLSTVCFAESEMQRSPFYFEPGDYTGSDIERINAALKDAGKCGGTVRIGKRQGKNAGDRRDFWLIDSAMLVPGNIHLILDNCTVKLSNSCRDNMIRSANCIPGIAPERLKNIRISGIGNAVLEGADLPRSTGDSGKRLHNADIVPEGRTSFGTDAGKNGESQTGDWRNVGILLVNVDGFTLEGVTIRESHAWAVSLEYCTYGQIRNMQFYSTPWKMVNGKREIVRNQDGLDLRRGCRNIQIENISGETGDDLVALTAIAAETRPSGQFQTTEFRGGDENVADGDVCNITIRNIRGYSSGRNQIVRFLNTRGVKMYNIILDGVIDTSIPELRNHAAVRIGDNVERWGGVTPLGDTFGFHISNIISYANKSVAIVGSLQDSVISNVINFNPATEPVTFDSGREYVKNVIVNSAVNGVTFPAAQNQKGTKK